jgi:hypothetical protein
MIKKEVCTKMEGSDNMFFVEDKYEDEPIGKNILDSIDDFYNLMHLIKKSWVNKSYHLKMEEAGYNIYDENEDLAAWIGVKEKYKSLMFIIHYGSLLYKNARKTLKGPMEIFDWDEDLWVYSELKIMDILAEENVEKQQKVIENWIKKIQHL